MHAHYLQLKLYRIKHFYLFFADIIYILDTPTVVGIAFAAFVIGALLTGALWFIYSHTGEKTSVLYYSKKYKKFVRFTSVSVLVYFYRFYEEVIRKKFL